MRCLSAGCRILHETICKAWLTSGASSSRRTLIHSRVSGLDKKLLYGVLHTVEDPVLHFAAVSNRLPEPRAAKHALIAFPCLCCLHLLFRLACILDLHTVCVVVVWDSG